MHQRAGGLGGLFIIELFVSLKVEIFARLAAPLDLALDVIVALDPPFQLGKRASASPNVSRTSSPRCPRALLIGKRKQGSQVGNAGREIGFTVDHELRKPANSVMIRCA